MKNIGFNDKFIVIVIFLILVIFGINEGLELINKLSLLEKLLSGFIAFAIVGFIMRFFDKILGIWLGKNIGIILFAVMTILVGKLFF